MQKRRPEVKKILGDFVGWIMISWGPGRAWRACASPLAELRVYEATGEGVKIFAVARTVCREGKPLSKTDHKAHQ